jgi:uncharacterized protein (DUF736 family)
MAEQKEEIGAVWVKQTKSGDDYLSIQLNGQWYKAWLNKYKKTDKHPNFRIFAENQSANSSQSQSASRGQRKPATEEDLGPAFPSSSDDMGDVPF